MREVKTVLASDGVVCDVDLPDNPSIRDVARLALPFGTSSWSRVWVSGKAYKKLEPKYGDSQRVLGWIAGKFGYTNFNSIRNNSRLCDIYPIGSRHSNTPIHIYRKCSTGDTESSIRVLDWVRRERISDEDEIKRVSDVGREAIKNGYTGSEVADMIDRAISQKITRDDVPSVTSELQSVVARYEINTRELDLEKMEELSIVMATNLMEQLVSIVSQYGDVGVRLSLNGEYTITPDQINTFKKKKSLSNRSHERNSIGYYL